MAPVTLDGLDEPNPVFLFEATVAVSWLPLRAPLSS
jgi:hypothetical protein